MDDNFGVEDYAQKQDLIEATDAVEKALEMPEGLREIVDDEEPSEPEIRNFAELKRERASRRITVLQRTETQAKLGVVSFASLKIDGSIDSSYYMQKHEWEDLGKPDEIAVHVYPRNILDN